MLFCESFGFTGGDRIYSKPLDLTLGDWASTPTFVAEGVANLKLNFRNLIAMASSLILGRQVLQLNCRGLRVDGASQLLWTPI